MRDSVRDPQPNRLQWLTWAPWVLALAGLLFLAGFTVWLGISGLAFPYQLDYGEGLLLHFVNEWAHGQPIYGAIGQYPFITANYPPLTIGLALALTPVLGIGYLAGRIWTLIAIAAAATIIAAWVRRAGGRWLPAAAGALIFVGSPYIYHWAPLFRADLAGLALTLGGLYAVYRAAPPRKDPARGDQKPGLLWLAVVLFVAGLYAKQSFLFAPAAAVVYLFFFADRRQAIRLVAGLALLGGGLFLLINLFTAGGFWQGLVVSNVNPFLVDEFLEQLGDYFGTFAILGLLTAWYVVDKFVLDRVGPLRDRISPLDLYLIAALVSLLLAGKAGAWENYFFEALAAFCLCGGLGLARLARHGMRAYCLLAPLLILAQVALMWHTPRVANRYLELTRDSNEAMQPILAHTSDPIISEDMGQLVTNDKVLDYCSFQYSQLARAGRWDQSWELDQLRERALSMVILETGTRLDVDRYQRFTREFLSELDRNYQRVRGVGKYELYEADPLQHEQRAEFGEELALVGWSLHAPPELKAGDTISLTVVWQAQQTLDSDYTAYAHLVDEDGQGWSGDDHAPYDGLYPTSAWGAGEMVRDTFHLDIPAGAPPGLYDVVVGWYPTTGEPAALGDSIRVAVVPVDWKGTGPEALAPVYLLFGDAISLEGYGWQSTPDALQVTVRWSAHDTIDTDYTVFVHLVDPGGEGEALAQGDAPPLDGRWPTSLWLTGLQLDDTHAVPFSDLAPGTYQLLVGLYDPSTGIRLTLPDGSDAALLTEITIP